MKTTVCIAGPGSGKTRTLIQRVERAINLGADPAKIACITFTNAAADEMSSRLRKGFFGESPVGLGYIGTLHGFMLRALRLHGDHVGFGPRVMVISDEHAASVLDEIIATQNYKGTKSDVDEALAVGPAVCDRKVLRPSEVVAATFFRTIKRQNMVTFDTLLHYGAKIASMVGGYTHLFVDEAQDASDVDFAIYRALPIKERFFVADPDQSIYGFRGGNVANIVELTNGLAGEDIMLLELNYRCDAAITRAADALISHNLGRIPKQTVSATGRQGLAVFREHGHPGSEMQAVAAELAGMDDPDSCAVLCRSNHQVSMWREYLPTRGVPVKRRRQVERPQDWNKAMALLAMFADPSNDMAAHWAALLLHGKDVANRMQREALMRYEPLAVRVHPNPWAASIDSITGLIGPLVSRGSLEVIKEFIDKLAPGSCIQDLCLRIKESEAGSVEEGKGVTVCTMHAAKGREWSAVWIPGLDQGTMPGKRKDQDIEEERRLLYVAMTRAKRELRLSYSATPVARFGSAKPSEPSQFIAEANLLAVKDYPVDTGLTVH